MAGSIFVTSVPEKIQYDGILEIRCTGTSMHTVAPSKQFQVYIQLATQ
jgi:hypothetical protein